MNKKVVVSTKMRPTGVAGRLQCARGGRTNPTCTAQAVRSGQRVQIGGRTITVDGAVGQFLLGPDHRTIFEWASRAQFGHSQPAPDNKSKK